MADNFEFNELLVTIQDSLSHEDRIRFHFLFIDTVPRATCNDISIGGTMKLFETLRNLDRINAANCYCLIVAFERIGRIDLAQRLKEFSNNNEQNEIAVEDKFSYPISLNFELPEISPEKMIKNNRRQIAFNRRKRIFISLVLAVIALLLVTVLIFMAIYIFRKCDPSNNINRALVPVENLIEYNSSFVILGYYLSWSVYRKYYVSNITAEKLTHINYAHAKIDTNGRVGYSDSHADIEDKYEPSMPSNFVQLSNLKRQYPHLRTLISIFAGDDPLSFSYAASSAANRSIFAESCIQFIKKHDFDGIDLNWILFSVDNKENYVLLVKELRQQMNQTGKHYLLTIRGGVLEKIKYLNLIQMIPYLDWINVLTQDFAGPWQPKTNHQAALRRNHLIKPHEYEAAANCDAAIRAYMDAGVPSAKLVMGIPLYGRGWQEVESSENNGYRQTASMGTSMGTWDKNNVFDYDHLKRDYIPTMKRYFDKKANVPYLFNSTTRIWISYEDTESVNRKAQYIKDARLRGAHLWDLCSDQKGELIDVIHRTLVDIFDS